MAATATAAAAVAIVVAAALFGHFNGLPWDMSVCPSVCVRVCV